ncbi:MAG TPA: plastocyanin/azurin family copper-binding protein [Geminicoccaceae bacterium]|nr:plastocyanin/azurin family copper-binding protein [Geminicoccaceae bacterium]
MLPACPPRRSSRRRLAIFLALLAFPCGARADTYVVELGNFAVEPQALTIHAGDTVEWRVAAGRHSSTAKDRAWDSGELAQGAVFAQRFDLPGVYPYFCTTHDFMRGTITVLEPPSFWERLKAWLAAGW